MTATPDACEIEIRQKVRLIIADLFGNSECNQTADEAPLFSHYCLGNDGAGFLDAIDGLSLFLQIEDDFGLAIPDEEQERFRTIADISRYLAHRMRG